jgi:hypothetical protein
MNCYQCSNCFLKVHNSYSIRENRQYLDNLAELQNIATIEDWYKVNTTTIFIQNGKQLLRRFDYSICKMLSTLYPDTNWQPWRFHRNCNNVWSIESNQKKYVEWLEEQLDIVILDDWYRITCEQLFKFGASILLQKYNYSLVNLLEAIYPNFCWIPWKFSQVSNDFWDNYNNRRKFMDWIAELHEINSLDDWYRLKHMDFNNYGSLLHIRFENSVIRALSSVYQDTLWLPWLFDHAPQGYWHIKKHQEEYLEWLEDQLQIKNADDWSRISSDILKQYKGNSLLALFGGSLKSLLEYHTPSNVTSSKY